MLSENSMRAHIALKATDDSEFRARLIADPKGTVEQECGITFPDNCTFHVFEETATDTYMILPINQLNTQELQAVAGGDWCGPGATCQAEFHAAGY